MRLYHVTTKSVHGSIAREGIDPEYSKGARRECWYVVPSLLAWAMLHVQRRHGVDLPDLIAFEVLIPAKNLTRRRRGVYTTTQVVEPLFFLGSTDGEAVAASYPHEARAETQDA